MVNIILNLEMKIIGLEHAIAKLSPEYAKKNGFVEYKGSMWRKKNLENYKKQVLKE